MRLEAGCSHRSVSLKTREKSKININPHTQRQRGASVGSSDTMKDQEKLSKDAQVISSILKDVGIEEWDPRVLQQMMEYSYRWL